MSSDAQINVNDPEFLLLLLIVIVVMLVPRLLPRFVAGWRSLISPENLLQFLERKEDVLLLDVRTTAEFFGELGHIRGALLYPHQRLTEMIRTNDSQLQAYSSKPIITICRSGSRASFAARGLKRAGFKNVYVLAGGMNQWRNERYPVVMGRGEGKDE